jgi:hypothetical protein
MAPKAKNPSTTAAGFDPVRWVGKAFLAVVQKDPALYRDLYYIIRDRVGNNLAGELVSALHDAGADQFDKPKREMTDEAKAALVARLAKGKRKKQGIDPELVEEPTEADLPEELK